MTKSKAQRLPVAESATEGLEAILDSAKEFMSTLSDQKGTAVDELRARLAATIDSTGERLASLRSRAGEAGRQAARSTLGYARSNPWKTVALAVLAVAAWQVVSHLAEGDDEDGG